MTTIQNKAPAAVVVVDTTIAYTVVCLANNIGIDPDISGRVVQVDSAYHATYSGDAPYTVVSGLSQNVDYQMRIGRFDSMNNTLLVENGFGVNFSPNAPVRLHSYPSITSHTVTGEFVEIGSSPPVLNLVLGGHADTIQVEYSEVGQNSWQLGWAGPFAESINVIGLPVGTYDIRVRGVINLPAFPFSETSGWVGLAAVTLENTFSTPTAPKGVTTVVSKLAEPSERYDVEVSWNWERGAGPEIRFFVLERLDVSRFGSNWANAELVNTGASPKYTVINHPFGREFKYRVTAVSWGDESTNRATGVETSLTINNNTPTVDLVRSSRIELNYAHIKATAIRESDSQEVQTFLLDAGTGSLSIGALDGQGNAPITVDGLTGNLSVSGSVITDTIAAANFVLANTNGTSNPALYSAAKTSYQDASEGIYMGHDASNKFKFDLGNSTKYIRWDGDNLRISGDVLIGTGTDSLSSFTASPSTAYYEVTNIVNIPTSDSGKSTNYKSKTGNDPITGSVLIYLKNDHVDGGFTRYYSYSGTTWSSFSVIVEGGLLASGTISGNALQANTISGNEISSNLTLKVGSGNASSTISAIGSYRFWVGDHSADLAPFRVTSAGHLEINSTKTRSALVVKDNVIKVFDESGQLRVQVGDLTA